MFIFKIIRKIKYANEVFRANKEYLMPGKYILQDSCRVFCHQKAVCREESFIHAEGYGTAVKAIVWILNILGFFSVPSRSGGRAAHHCSMIYIANNHDKIREIKLFDFVQDQVLVFPASEQAREEKKTVFHVLHNVFPMPRVADFNDARRFSYTETLIRKAPCPEDADPFCAICQAHIRQAGQLTSVPDALKDFMERPYDDQTQNQETADFQRELAQKVSREVMTIKDGLAIQHGDLSINNILYGSADGRRTFFWIDWEHINYRPFYYDAFFLMVNSAVCEDDDGFTKAYLAGTYDTALKNLFQAYGHSYLPEKRREYLYLFMLDFVAERLCRKVSISALSRYRKYVYKYF